MNHMNFPLSIANIQTDVYNYINFSFFFSINQYMSPFRVTRQRSKKGVGKERGGEMVAATSWMSAHYSYDRAIATIYLSPQ